MQPIAVVGASGAVGRELVAILRAHGIDAERLRLAASERSRAEGWRGLDDALFRGAGLAFFCVPADVARAWVPRALRAGARVVDCGSAFRRDAGVPLVVPEINGALARSAPLVASPNCSATLLALALAPLGAAFGLEGVAVTTFQAVSGRGRAAMEELRAQTRAVLDGTAAVPAVFQEPCAFNVFSHDSAVDPATGLSAEEEKLVAETRRILDRPALPISPACQRVATLRAHVEAVTVALRDPAEAFAVRAALAGAAGLELVDDRAANRFPTAVGAAGRDAVLVGRVRPDPAWPPDTEGRTRRFQLLVAGDQLRKGAALNAVQCARAMDLL